MYWNKLFNQKQPVLFQVLVIIISVQSINAAESRHHIDTAETFTADTLVEWVLETNPGLYAIQAAAESAAHRIVPAGSLDDPVVSYVVAPLTFGSNRLNQRFDFSQKLPWPGTLAAREAAARHEAVSTDFEFDALRLQVIARTKSAYAEWRFVDEALTIHHETRALLDELIATAQTRYAAGRALKQDVLHAEVERSDLDKHLFLLRRQQATVQARINALLNRVSDTSLPAATPTRQQSTLPPLETLQTLALAQHPELSRLNAQIASRRNRITLAEKAFYPDFQVGVGYNSLWNDTDKRPVFGVAINVPLDRSKRRSDLSRARADTRQAEWSLVERRAELLADLAQAHAGVIEAQASVTLYQNELLPLSTEYLDTAIADYQSGAGTFLNVITAEQRKLNTDLGLARTRADYARRLAALEHWVGASIDTLRPTPIGDKK